MTEKRFIGSCAGFYDKYKENKLLWSEWEEIIRILNNLNEKSVERSKALSKLQKENNQLKKENAELRQELFEARKDYLIDTADISDKLYLDKDIEELRKKIYGDV